MSAPINDGGPAFPVPVAFHPGRESMSSGPSEGFDGGMTLRDWFAGHALSGILHTPSAIGEAATETGENSAAFASRAAYEFADAMLKARQPEATK